ncbi:MAG: flavin reductase family protein [Gammaproteobacteria bacterium]
MSNEPLVKQSGLKRFFSAFVDPNTYDFWSRQLGSTHAWTRCFARVIARNDEGDSTFTLRLQPNGNFTGFTPGQHVNLTAEIEGRRVTRSYSFSNVPNKDGWVELTVRRDPSGQMSDWLFNHAHKGAVLELDGVFGDMTSDTFSGQSLVLLAGGSGVTPLMSLLREQAALEMPESVTLVYWERSDSSFCFTKELHDFAERFDNFKLHTIATQKNSDKRVSVEQLRSLNVEIANAQVLACGGGAFVNQAKHCTETTAAHFQSEAFTARPVAMTNESSKTFTVELLASKRLIEVSNQHSLLSALEEQGVVVQTGCRMGVCNTCSCKKVVGSTRHDDAAEMDSNTNASVRLCVTRAMSDLQLAI